MLLIVFDSGGTLIEDPFPQSVSQVCSTSLLSALQQVNPNFTIALLDAIVEAWTTENLTHDFPLASHFLQGEVWIMRAMSGVLSSEDVVPTDLIPIVSPILLSTYRQVAKKHISTQQQLPALRRCLHSIRQKPAVLAVASNDRTFATSAMLTWADLRRYFDYVFTSEALSRPPGRLIEKPSPAFFAGFEATIRETHDSEFGVKIYIGDNERNDIEAPSSLGYVTIRYINANNSTKASWLDHRADTRADYNYSEPDTLLNILTTIINES